MALEPVRRRPPKPPPLKAGPTDISDPLLRYEAKRAFVWLGMASLLALAVFLAQPLMIIFGGMVFAALVDGGARLLGRVLPLPRGWLVAIVLLLTTAFLAWVVIFAGSQIADQAAALPQTVRTQSLRVLTWLQTHGYKIDLTQASPA
jgi:putative permease